VACFEVKARKVAGRTESVISDEAIIVDEFSARTIDKARKKDWAQVCAAGGEEEKGRKTAAEMGNVREVIASACALLLAQWQKGSSRRGGCVLVTDSSNWCSLGSLQVDRNNEKRAREGRATRLWRLTA